jgi:hypothetical protein
MNTVFLVTAANPEIRDKIAGWFAARLSRVYRAADEITGKFRDPPVAVVVDKGKPILKEVKSAAGDATIIRIHIGQKPLDDGKLNHLFSYKKGADLALFLALEAVWTEQKGKRGTVAPHVPA